MEMVTAIHGSAPQAPLRYLPTDRRRPVLQMVTKRVALRTTQRHGLSLPSGCPELPAQTQSAHYQETQSRVLEFHARRACSASWAALWKARGCGYHCASVWFLTWIHRSGLWSLGGHVNLKFPLTPQQKAHKSCRRVSPSDSDPRQDLLWPQDFQASPAQHQPTHPVPITPSIPLLVFSWSPRRKPSAGDHSVHREQGPLCSRGAGGF